MIDDGIYKLPVYRYVPFEQLSVATTNVRAQLSTQLADADETNAPLVTVHNERTVISRATWKETATPFIEGEQPEFVLACWLAHTEQQIIAECDLTLLRLYCGQLNSPVGSHGWYVRASWNSDQVLFERARNTDVEVFSDVCTLIDSDLSVLGRYSGALPDCPHDLAWYLLYADMGGFGPGNVAIFPHYPESFPPIR
jgi:hypothetical protein